MAVSPPLPRPGEPWALFLDIDGTLVAIAPTPQAVRVEPGLTKLLGRLGNALGGALAIVSGRAIADIDVLLRPLVLPAAGLHGLEQRGADGIVARASVPHDAMTPLKPALAAFAAARPGLLFEDKGASVALHYRQVPRYGAAVLRFVRRLTAEAGPRLRLIEGRKVVELQPRGCDKGRAIAAFLDQAPFAGRRPVFAGDDRTDEDGFIVVNGLGGISIKVDAQERGACMTHARYRLPSVAALHDWLGAVAAALDVAPMSERPGGTAAIPSALS